MNQKHKQLTELQLSAEQREALERWAETEFVYSTLRLEGVAVEHEDVARAGSVSVAATDSDRSATALLESLRTVTSLVRAKGQAARLTADLLLSLHKVPGEASAFRSSAGEARRVKPAPAEALPVMIDSACQWYTADSFTELHPVEQASIVFLRLIEMQPFEAANERTALLAASLFTLRRELPPIIIKPEKHAAYRAALDEGIRMNTKPMVELIAEAVERSLEKMIRAIEENKDKR
ncbi:MAG: Fic family protein [Acidobacteriota bacterium]